MAGAGEVYVRGAVLSDAAAIARVHVDSWRETYRGVLDEGYFSEDAFQRRLQLWSRYLESPPDGGRLFVAETELADAGLADTAVADTGRRLIGFANAGVAVGEEAERGHTPARSLQLFTIYVLAGFHGGGAGQGLLDAVLATEPAQLWVLSGNARAIAFYERNGFALDGAEFTDPRDASLVELRMVR